MYIMKIDFTRTLCDTFKCLAKETWCWIGYSRAMKFQLKEETLTDINMLSIKTLLKGHISTKTFTKHEEGKNGADWEWWFRGRRGRWIGFRVQAKIINLDSGKFEHLHYKNRDGDYQCDILIRNAKNPATSPKIPLYCFFIQTDDTTPLNHMNCVKEHYGCSLTSAFTVKNLRKNNKRHLIDLAADLKPWHCLFCCSDDEENDFISNIQNHSWENFIPRDSIVESGDNHGENFVTESPPKYVLEVFNGENNDNIEPPDSDLDGVIVVSENRKND